MEEIVHDRKIQIRQRTICWSTTYVHDIEVNLTKKYMFKIIYTQFSIKLVMNLIMIFKHMLKGGKNYNKTVLKHIIQVGRPKIKSM